MSAPTADPRTWSTRRIIAEATEDIDLVVDAWTDTAECVAALTRTAHDIDHAGLDYAALRSQRITH